MNHRTSVGLDVHARSIRAAAFIPETGEIVEKGFSYDPSGVAAWALAMPGPVRCVYESGPTGFDLARRLGESGVDCRVGAVSKMIRPAGDRIKTDKRDAVFLARMLAVGNIVEVRIPSPAEEAARDLARAREDVRHDLMRARHLLSKFLLRKGIVYDKSKTTWTKTHRVWLSGLTFDDACEQLVFGEYLAGVTVMEQRRGRLDAAIARQAAAPEFAGVTARLSGLRGIATVTAFSIAAEIGDFSRFPDARSFMSYLGLVPSESSSGETVSRGKITRAGNIHVRTLLMESAWHHARRYSPTQASPAAGAAATGPLAAAIANEANRRLHERFAHLKRRGKPACVINAAVAREMAGFLWALANCEG